ncbi:hypothetical protein [uncultured Aquimarina sp.]|uniref:hypothetical protein n=1 Tax=uncultured Aquimarina sp. TaxID=575652 RepID=UPI00262101D1|nr:hypothetical protein [uncultured Aquimarina sp.]
MLENILNLKRVQTLRKNILKQVNGGDGCACGGNWIYGNEFGNGQGGQCYEC